VPEAPPKAPLLVHLKKLAAHSAVYGAADVLTNVVNLLLVPVYTAPGRLTPRDYGALALLLLWGTVAKIVFRLGLDAGFFRVHYEMKTDDERRRLAGTVLVFAALVSSALFAAIALFATPITGLLFGHEAPPARWVVLVAADVFAGSFAFVPLALLRIEDRPGTFSALSVFRHTLNTALKVVFVVRGFGVEGILWSDLAATTAFALVLLPVLRGRVHLGLDASLLRPVLQFALPKVPHGILVQALNLADRRILDVYVTRPEVGLYQMGSTFGSGVKFALSAFEPAWSPFVYSRIREDDAPRTLARVALAAFSVFTFAAVGLAVLGGELLGIMTPGNPAFRAAAPVIPVIAFAYLLHGLFLLTSIGIGIAREARYYPAITAAAAAANVGLNLLLVPRWGMMGAAWATVAAYAVMAGLGAWVSRRLYPMPLDWPRFAGLGLLALTLTVLSGLAPDALGPRVLIKVALVAAYPAAVLALGLAGDTPWRRLREAVTPSGGGAIE
jgi:O-antigen/teichoic acid export membrane protein